MDVLRDIADILTAAVIWAAMGLLGLALYGWVAS